MQAGLKSKKLFYFLIIPLVVALIPGLIYFKSNDIKAFAENLKPLPERFTELYFEDHALLPKSASKDTVYDFRFTTHNLEYIDTGYNYAVFIEPENGEKQLLDKGSFTLRHDEYRTVTESFKIINPAKRLKITVELIDKKQTIHFWMEAENI